MLTVSAGSTLQRLMAECVVQLLTTDQLAYGGLNEFDGFEGFASALAEAFMFWGYDEEEEMFSRLPSQKFPTSAGWKDFLVGGVPKRHWVHELFARDD